MTEDEELVKNNFNVHDHLKHMNVDELKAIQKRQSFPYAVGAINIDGNLNMGMMIRTAAIMGAEKFFVFGKRKYDKRSCVGSHNYIEIEKHADFDDWWFKKTNLSQHIHYVPFLIETGGWPIDKIKSHMESVRKGSSNFHPLILFGSESNGIPSHLLERFHLKYEIPQVGVIRSLNVSAACAIALWEVRKAFE